MGVFYVRGERETLTHQNDRLAMFKLFTSKLFLRRSGRSSSVSHHVSATTRRFRHRYRHRLRLPAIRSAILETIIGQCSGQETKTQVRLVVLPYFGHS